jgi:hypothetical protein
MSSPQAYSLVGGMAALHLGVYCVDFKCASAPHPGMVSILRRAGLAAMISRRGSFVTEMASQSETVTTCRYPSSSSGEN